MGQNPSAGGEFQYRKDLRSETDSNFDGIARLLEGDDPLVQTSVAAPGTLSIFRGRNTAHCVTPTVGERERIIAVFSYMSQPGVIFSDEDRMRFYGRAVPIASGQLISRY